VKLAALGSVSVHSHVGHATAQATKEAGPEQRLGDLDSTGSASRQRQQEIINIQALRRSGLKDRWVRVDGYADERDHRNEDDRCVDCQSGARLRVVRAAKEMTKMTQAEYQGKVDWLRSHPHGMVAQAVRRELRAFEAELKSQGKTVGGSLPSSTILSPWYVSFHHDRPKQPLISKCRHRDRDCQHIRDIGDEWVREANEVELERLDPCQTCG
jgi:hypothetical protein